MEALIIFFYVGALILYVWMVILFVNMAKDVRALKKRGDLDNWTVCTIKKEVKGAILTGKQDEVYNKIITQITGEIYQECIKTGDNTIMASAGYGMFAKLKAINTALPMVDNCLKLIGRELPPELKTVEDYVKFYNSNSPSKPA